MTNKMCYILLKTAFNYLASPLRTSTLCPFSFTVYVVVLTFLIANQYVNVEFTAANRLQHGKRYFICLHADAMTVKHEKWTEKLAEVNACSDGIIVDTTDPKPGKVWVGTEKGAAFLVR
jgi:hypothetical protein